MTLNHEKLHLDIVRKLNRINRPQKYLSKKLGVSRSTLWRINNKKEIKLTTFLKLVKWLEKDIKLYIKN